MLGRQAQRSPMSSSRPVQRNMPIPSPRIRERALVVDSSRRVVGRWDSEG